LTKLKFLKKDRLHLNKDFQSTFKKGEKLSNPFLKMFVYKITDSHKLTAANGIRLGLVVSHKIGDAVIRNKTKRRLREIFRLNRQKIAVDNVNMLFVPKKETTTLDYNRLEKVVLALWKKAGLTN
jgi:ribonuclease P protein component